MNTKTFLVLLFWLREAVTNQCSIRVCFGQRLGVSETKIRHSHTLSTMKLYGPGATGAHPRII